MANNEINVRHQLAYKTSAEWYNANPVLLNGELAYTSDQGNIFKIGNGTSTWRQLPYVNYAEHPLIHKKYESTSYYATSAGSWEAASWYFMSVKPDSWYKPWKVKFKVHSYCPGYTNVDSYTWATYTGRADSIIYCNWNDRYDGAHYYLPYYPLKKAGFDAGYGHAIGVSILYGSSYTSSAYYRTFEIDYYECENCTVTILDTPVKWASWTGAGTTNYGSLGGPDAYNRGLRETGDDNTVTENRIAYFAGKTGAKGIWATSLFMEDANGTYQNICTASDGTVTSSNRTAATTKIANTNGFKVGSTIYLTNTNYNANTAISGSAVIYSATSVFDTRYSMNTTLTAGSLTAYKPVYLVGTINATDGLYYLDTVWWTQTPTETGKVYVLIGGVYDSSTSYCRATLYEDNPWYYYNGTRLVRYLGDGDTNTTYSMTRDGESIKLTPSEGSAQSITLSSLINGLGEGSSQAQLNDYLVAQYVGGGTSTTSYHRRKVSNVVNKTVVDNALGKGSDTTKYYRNDGTWAVPPDNNTTYTFANGTNGFTVTPSGGSAQTVTVTPSITNNVTGSGTSGSLVKFNGTNTITNGPAIGSDTTKFLNNAGNWAVPPNDNTTYSAGTGITITGDNNAINVTYGSAANTACQGNDSRLSNARPSSDVVQTYSSTSTVPISGKGVAAALGTLDGSITGSAAASKTLTAFSQTDGKVTATFSNIAIAESQVTNLTTDLGNKAPLASPALTGTPTAPTATAGTNTTQIATTAFVQTAIDNLPEPMVFKGSLGTGGTITALPVDGSASIGDTYKVITAGTYASIAAKVGDTFICDSKTSSANTWTLIPSGDEPSGTVTSVTIKATSPIAIDSSAAITTSGTRTLSHANSGVTAGTYRSVTVNATGHITAGTNPTTLTGYGITDAKIASGVITLGSNTITPLTASSTLDATKLSGTIPTSCYTDTKNTAGSTDTSSKIFLIGATSQAANPQTYSDNELYVTSGALQAKTVSASGGINANTANASNAGGVSLYSTDPTAYGITMRGFSLGKYGAVQGDWAGYLCFSGALNRGWIYRHAGTNVASINGEGHIVTNGSVTVGGNSANTSGCKMEYNTTTQSLDFIFN